MRYYIGILILLFTCDTFVYGQPKPTRPNRNEIVSSPQQPKRQNRKKVKKDTYITINGYNSESSNYTVNGGTEYFSVSTDANSWSVWGLPTWCAIDSKTQNSFRLYVYENTSGLDRKDYFEIRTPKGHRARIQISQSGYIDGDVIACDAVAIDSVAIYASMLCIYKGGFFIRNNDNWYEYRSHQKNGVWRIYSQYSSDENYFYVRSESYELAIPQKNGISIYMLDKDQNEWSPQYTIVKEYRYCPVRSSQIFCFDNGFFIKRDEAWELYYPNDKDDEMWAAYTQYSVDDDFYYIKNSSDVLAIPRKSSNNFYMRKGDEWIKTHQTMALYDPLSPDAGSGIK